MRRLEKLFSAKAKKQGNWIILFFLIMIISSFVSPVNAPDITISENNPVLELISSTSTSVSLSWYQTVCVVDCNTYHLTNFVRYELYQKNLPVDNYSLAYTTSDIRVNMILLSNLELNSSYSFYLILIWDWSNLSPEIADTYGGNKISNVITINLSKQPLFTTQINNLSRSTFSDIEKTINRVNIPYSIIILSLIAAALLIQMRK